MRTFSFGGGVQSTAVLALQALGRLPEPYEAFIFANVGHDSEDPLTLKYFEEYHIPFAEKHGINLIEVERIKRDKTRETLWEQITRPGSRSINIPVRMQNGAPGRRKCTRDYKIRVVRKWQRKHGSSFENPAITGLGISVDEIQRARTDSGYNDQILEYPLIDLGMSREDCYAVIEEAGLPRPPRSACWFCPFHTAGWWKELKEGRPELFEKACELESFINGQRDNMKKTHVYLSRYGKPLAEAYNEEDDLPEGPEGCDSGSCFT